MDKPYNFEERIILSKVLIRLFVMKKQGYIKMDYDFDRLKNLYIDDPQEFEKITNEMINEVIDRAPEDRRENIRAKQWRLQQDLNKIKNPLERMNRMVSLFWEQVAEFNNAVNGLGDITTKPVKIKPINNKNNVIDINKKK